MRRYGVTALNEEGIPEVEAFCVVAIQSGWSSGQCGHKRGFGPGGLYCGQHAKMLLNGKRLWVPEDEPPATAGR